MHLSATYKAAERKTKLGPCGLISCQKQMRYRQRCIVLSASTPHLSSRFYAFLEFCVGFCFVLPLLIVAEAGSACDMASDPDRPATLCGTGGFMSLSAACSMMLAQHLLAGRLGLRASRYHRAKLD